MTDDKKEKFKTRMAALHDKYCAQLPDKYLEIEASWNDYQSDLSNPEFLELFYRLIHTLKGTAATFGFVKQSDICFEIQRTLLDPKENSKTLDTEGVNKIQNKLNELKKHINTPAEDIYD